MRLSSFLCLVSLFFLLTGLSSSVWAQGVQVSGVITAAETGSALEGARVTLLHPTTRDTLRSSVYTDASGRYVVDGVVTAIEDQAIAGSSSYLLDAFPNPLMPSSETLGIRFTSPPNSHSPDVELFDLFGRRLNLKGYLAAGVYFLRLRFDDGTTSPTRKLVLREGGTLDIRMELAEVAPDRGTSAVAGRAAASKGIAGSVLFAVQRDGYVTLEENRHVDMSGPDDHHFSLSSYGLLQTRAERVAAVDDVFVHWRTVADRSIDEQNDALAQFLESHPAFSSAVVSKDQTVTAHFLDGLPVVIINNRPLDDDDAAKIDAAGKYQAPQDLPGGDRAYVMDVAGTGKGAPALVAAMLKKAGYTLAGGGVLAGTIEDFRSVNAAAAVHISSHGAVMQTFDSTGSYAIGTSSFIRKLDYDRCSIMSCDDGYWEEYYSGHLALGIYAEDRRQSDPRGHWAVTRKFVEKHWSFAPDGLLFLDACTSASDDAAVASFRAPLYKAKLGFFLGWNAAVGAGFAAKTASYFFSRVTGDENYLPEKPPQRPFDYRNVWLHMAATRRTSFAGATLIYKQPGDDPGFLLPSIERVSVFEPGNEILLIGSFGKNTDGQARVSLGGRPLNILSWDADYDEITAELPSDAGGDVVVEVGSRKSNAVPITVWTPTLRLEGDISADFDLSENTLTYLITCKVPFRADVHPYRSSPGEELQEQFAVVYGGRDLACSWTGSGSGTNPDGYKYTLSGSGSVEWEPELLKYFAFGGSIDLIGFTNGGKRGISLTYSLPDVLMPLTVDPPEGDDGCGGTADPDPYQMEITVGNVGDTIQMEFNTGYDIQAGSQAPAAGKVKSVAAPAASHCGVPATGTRLLRSHTWVEWDAAPAANAPSSSTKT